jgi:hypothetical protein
MASKKALYVNFIKEVMHSAPPEAEDLRYFVEGILPNLRPLSDDEYTHGPAVILQTLAPASYLIHGNDVYWLSQWEPGLIAGPFYANGADGLDRAPFADPRFWRACRVGGGSPRL